MKNFTSVAAAARDFFGCQSAGDWMREWKALNDGDKAEIRAGLEKLGYIIENKA